MPATWVPCPSAFVWGACGHRAQAASHMRGVSSSTVVELPCTHACSITAAAAAQLLLLFLHTALKLPALPRTGLLEPDSPSKPANTRQGAGSPAAVQPPKVGCVMSTVWQQHACQPPGSSLRAPSAGEQPRAAAPASSMTHSRTPCPSSPSCCAASTYEHTGQNGSVSAAPEPLCAAHTGAFTQPSGVLGGDITNLRELEAIRANERGSDSPSC